ncbi:MAG: hypothetical protein PHI13_09715 [Methylococcales bacterium]|nr:hypothetical protein [Methylococcales bacterium]
MLLEKSGKITHPLMPLAARIPPASLVSSQQGFEKQLRNDLTPFRDSFRQQTLMGLPLSSNELIHF